MPIYLLNENLWFPDASKFEADIVAVGGDLRQERLIEAYRRGIFPWYGEPGNIQWWCPQERCVLYVDEFRLSHSMRNTLNKKKFSFSFDRAFNLVIEGCREGLRQENTWILDEMAEAYTLLHNNGIAHSVEVWEGDHLAGGLYGVSLGHIFFGESMFSRVKDSSKAGLFFLVSELHKRGWKMIDCQVHNDHLESLGARVISREIFLQVLKEELNYPTITGKWGVL
ncbi:MAG: leucyl/phenylalanyl-tRNA--protein transferase [Crocinitomicaceae bacterium]|nr:leucyl/phenylalanyl-tRNA--protein transferase [Crocinitomicaceae bacterium]